MHCEPEKPRLYLEPLDKEAQREREQYEAGRIVSYALLQSAMYAEIAADHAPNADGRDVSEPIGRIRRAVNRVKRLMI